MFDEPMKDASIEEIREEKRQRAFQEKGLAKRSENWAKRREKEEQGRQRRRDEREAAEAATRAELSRAHEQQQDFAVLSPKAWLKKYGSQKPESLVDRDSAVKLISKRMTYLALHTLSHVCENSKNDTARVAAAREILDRGWGKAHLQPLDVTNPTGADITITFATEAKMQQTIDADVEEEEQSEEQPTEVEYEI